MKPFQPYATPISFVAVDKQKGKAYRIRVTLSWMEKYDNFHSVSIGYTIGKDLTRRQLAYFLRNGQAKEITLDEWKHAGCLSGCVRRGDPTCRW